MTPGPRDAIALRTLRMLGTRVADGSNVDWHPAALASRVVECFHAVQLAWSRRDAQELRPYVSDAMLAQVDSWFDSFEDLSQVNRIENLKLEHTTLSRIEFDDSAEEDRLLADVAFSARDWLEDLRTGSVLDGHPEQATRFEQQWTFVRDAELGWVIDAVEPHSGQAPSAAAAGGARTDRRARRPRPARHSGAPARGVAVPVPGGVREAGRPPTQASGSGALRVALVLLLCVVAVAGAARIGLSLGRASVADPGDATRARLQAKQNTAVPAFRRAYNEAQARGRTVGLTRGRQAGRTRGTRQGQRAGRTEGERQVAAAAAAATAAAQARTAAGSGTAASGGTPRR